MFVGKLCIKRSDKELCYKWLLQFITVPRDMHQCATSRCCTSCLHLYIDVISNWTLYIMIIGGKKILVIIIMVVLISSVVAGAVSFFNKPQTSRNNNNAILNARLNQVVDFCIRSLPNGTSACDNQLLPVVNEICGQDGAKAMIDACTDGKVLQYYKARNIKSNIESNKTTLQ